MNAIGAVLYREACIRATNITFLFWDLVYPLLYMLVFGVGIEYGLAGPLSFGGIDYNSFFLAGALGMASFGIASNTAWSFFMDRDNGIFFEMLTYPLRRSEYLFGKVTFNLFVSLVQAAVAVAIGAALLHIPLRFDLLPLLAFGVVVGAAAWFFFYAIFALRIRRNDVFNSVTSVFYFVFLFASSMFYPLNPLPRWFRWIAYANPVSWEVDFLRYTSVGMGTPKQIWIEAACFLVFGALSFVLAVQALRTQE
jgi:ABC-type multidrug transport system permease subunit